MNESCSRGGPYLGYSPQSWLLRSACKRKKTFYIKDRCPAPLRVAAADAALAFTPSARLLSRTSESKETACRAKRQNIAFCLDLLCVFLFSRSLCATSCARARVNTALIYIRDIVFEKSVWVWHDFTLVWLYIEKFLGFTHDVHLEIVVACHVETKNNILPIAPNNKYYTDDKQVPRRIWRKISASESPMRRYIRASRSPYATHPTWLSIYICIGVLCTVMAGQTRLRENTNIDKT